MRLDLLLKQSGIIKRRTVAQALADNGKISINGKVAKPSKDINEGDIIEVNYYKTTLKVKVLKIINSSKKDDANEMYEVLEVIERN